MIRDIELVDELLNKLSFVASEENKQIPELIEEIIDEYIKNKPVKKCANCERYFIPKTRNDEIYCDRVVRKGKTCKQVGWYDNLDKDEARFAYRKTYQKMNKFKNLNKDDVNHVADYNEWVEQAKGNLNDYYRGDISLSKFKEWLDVRRD